MADEPEPNHMGEVLMLLGGLAALIALWFFVGGPGRTDLRGLFLAPPQPLGTGAAYGPQFGSTTESGQDNSQQTGVTSQQNIQIEQVTPPQQQTQQQPNPNQGSQGYYLNN